MPKDWDGVGKAVVELRAFVDPADPDSTDPATRGRLLGFTEYGPVYSGLGGIVLDPAGLLLEDALTSFQWSTEVRPRLDSFTEYAKAYDKIVARARAAGFTGSFALEER